MVEPLPHSEEDADGRRGGAAMTVDTLRAGVTGEVLVPGSAAYESARLPAMTRFRQVRPQAVVRCATAADVAATLGYAREHGIHVTPRSGGHCFAARSSTDGIVLDVGPMRSVSVSPDGVATIGAGAQLGGLYDALDQYGVTIPAGCGPTVGIAGLTLGGGLGLLGRRYGLTSDRLRAAQVVLADGRVVDADEHHEPDLFWALRGAGGGQFGVVTSLAFDTVPAPEATRFEVSLSEAGAADVIAAWQDWAPDAPDGMSASLKIAATGDGPAVVTVFGSMLGTQAEAEDLPSGLLDESGVRPVSASYQLMGYRRLKESLVGVGGDERPGEVFSRSEFFRGPLPAEAIERLLRVFGEDRVPACSRELNFTAMGGAYNRVAPDATAFVHREERFIVEHALVVRGEAAQVTRWVDRSYDCVHAWGSGRVYPNFPDPGLTNWAQAYHGGNYERLLQVKQTYDPERLFRFHQSL
jgi:FAD/FMN-containing dehydrogenase